MFKCDYEQQANNQVFILSGKLDQDSFTQFDNFVREKYAKGSDVILNLESLNYVSSVGLRSFISLAKMVHEDKKNINIKAAKEGMVRELIRLSGFTRLMPFI
jgi:anti-anti-sigma factor